MKNKKLFVIFSAILVVVIGALIMFRSGVFGYSDNGKDSYSKHIDIINDAGVDIYIYGDNIEFRDGITYTKLDNVSDIEVNTDMYSVLVINDRASNVTMRDADYECIDTYRNKGISIIYLGSAKIDDFIEKGFIKNLSSSAKEGVLGFRMRKIDTLIGIWTSEDEEILKSNKELLAQSICFEIVDFLKE